MYTDSAFSEAIKDPSTYRQNIVLKFANGYFSGNDGDIEQSGVEFDEFFCTSEDLTYGECPSSCMRASIINTDQMLRTFTWGECEAYIGYLSATADATVTEGVNATFEYGDDTFTAETDGFKLNGTVIHEGECYSLLYVRTGTLPVTQTLYAFGDGYAYKTVLGNTLTPEAISANRFMVNKMTKRGLIEWMPTYPMGVFNVYVTANGVTQTWRYAPMGIYNVEKPKNLSGDVVEIDNALDRMQLFDVDASEFLKYMDGKYPTSLGLYPTADGWRQEMCDWLGIQREASTISLGGDKYSPNTAQTLREILAFVADAEKCNFRFNRLGELAKKTVGTSMVEEVEIRRIEHSTLAVAEYVTRPIRKIVNKNLSGLTYITGDGDNAYYIYGNPFVQDNSGLSLATYGWYSYAPMSCVVLEADPLVDVGDAVGIWMSDEEYYAFVDAYNRYFTDEQGRIYTMTNTAVKMPLMHRILSWNGVCTATYEATGNRIRLVPSFAEQTDYNAVMASDKEAMKNKLSVSGTYDTLDWDSLTLAKIVSVINGVRTQEWGLANGCDIDGNGIVDIIDLSIVTSKLLGTLDITSGTFKSEISGTNAFNVFYIADASGRILTQIGVQGFIGNSLALQSGLTIGMSTIGNRVVLKEDGLYFYDENGNLTKHYPST